MDSLSKLLMQVPEDVQLVIQSGHVFAYDMTKNINIPEDGIDCDEHSIERSIREIFEMIGGENGDA